MHTVPYARTFRQEFLLAPRDRATNYQLKSCHLLHSCTKITFERLAVGNDLKGDLRLLKLPLFDIPYIIFYYSGPLADPGLNIRGPYLFPSLLSLPLFRHLSPYPFPSPFELCFSLPSTFLSLPLPYIFFPSFPL